MSNTNTVGATRLLRAFEAQSRARGTDESVGADAEVAAAWDAVGDERGRDVMAEFVVNKILAERTDGKNAV